MLNFVKKSLFGTHPKISMQKFGYELIFRALKKTLFSGKRKKKGQSIIKYSKIQEIQ
jgi:hypothetical protein